MCHSSVPATIWRGRGQAGHHALFIHLLCFPLLATPPNVALPCCVSPRTPVPSLNREYLLVEERTWYVRPCSPICYLIQPPPAPPGGGGYCAQPHSTDEEGEPRELKAPARPQLGSGRTGMDTQSDPWPLSGPRPLRVVSSPSQLA